MAVINATVASLLDITRTKNPDGTQAEIAEILTEDNEVLVEMAWKEGNLITGERTTVRDSLPGVGWRRLNEGVARGKSTSRQFDEAAALLEANSQVDRKLAILSGDIAKYRFNEAKAFMEAMNQEMAETLFYGNSTLYPTEFTGLAPRFNDTDGPTGDQIIDAGGTGTDNHSIWLINWGTETVSGIYPKGTVGGLMHMDTTSNNTIGPDGFPIGDEILDANSNPYLGYKDHWEWNCGLMVKDPRHVVRICNIDISLLNAANSTGADLQNLMVQALERVQSIGPNAAFYMPRTLRSMLRQQLLESKNSFLGYEDAAGRPATMFGEVPVRRTDALNVQEARVTSST